MAARGTVIQKIIDKHYVSGGKNPGELLGIRIDQTLTQDATGTMVYLELEAMNIEKVRTELSVSYIDHNMLQIGTENRNDHLYLQTIAAAKGIYFSKPGNGICHQVHLERFGAPGKTLLGADSHTPTNGGIGMLAIGAGGLDVALAMAGEPFRMVYPKIVGVRLTGKLRPWISAKDLILKILKILTTKGNIGCMMEYFGPGVKTLSVPERATITNMGAELGVTSSIFPSDEKTRDFLQAQGRGDSWMLLEADPDAEYDRIIEIDLGEIIPLAACPSSPDNIKTVKELSSLSVEQVIIGSCTNSSYADLMLVAMMLRGKAIHNNVTLSIAPGSRQVLEMLTRNGALADMIASGARILESACGPCIGQGQSPASDTVTVRTFNRNFSGRTGTKGDKAYLVSPAVAAAAALMGKFTDPRDLGMPFPVISEVKEFFINDNMIILPFMVIPALAEALAKAKSRLGGVAGEPSPKKTGRNIIRKSTIGNAPVNQPLPEDINGEVIIKVGDKITTDHIMPAGIHLKLRSNIPEYSKVVFECFNESGKPSFAVRAAKVRDSGRHGIIIGRESYGQGSSREHAAICPMHLGIKAVIAFTIERIHAANLVNFGIIPLFFVHIADYDKISQGDSLNICGVRSQLQVNKPVFAKLADGSDIELKHTLSEEDIEIILAGGRLNFVRGRAKR